MKPICVPCQRFFRVKQNGVWFTETMQAPGANNPPAGTAAPDQWKPYKLWAGDLWECEGCGAQIITGVAKAPIAEHFQPEFAANNARSQLQVNDR